MQKTTAPVAALSLAVLLKALLLVQTLPEITMMWNAFYYPPVKLYCLQRSI